MKQAPHVDINLQVKVTQLLQNCKISIILISNLSASKLKAYNDCSILHDLDLCSHKDINKITKYVPPWFMSPLNIFVKMQKYM